MNRTTSIAAPAVPLERMHAAAREACGLLKALANPDRLMILCFLSQGEACVSEIEAALGIMQPTLSQQLTVLRQEALVRTRRDGKNIHYSLASKQALAVIETLYLQYCGPRAPARKPHPRTTSKESP